MLIFFLRTFFYPYLPGAYVGNVYKICTCTHVLHIDTYIANANPSFFA